MNKIRLKNIFVVLLLGVACISRAQINNAVAPANSPIFSLRTDKEQRYWGFTASLVNGYYTVYGI